MQEFPEYLQQYDMSFRSSGLSLRQPSVASSGQTFVDTEPPFVLQVV